ncbi:MAG: TetR/AcrR family transcriptional regulator [Phenylobacterium sp.]|uniref:TetR/AcrR family transcriptional regulator n=1 Tax=Phenylobacterium sp. TaxID=1871053 RepID=UPI001A5DB2BD|nr:TetR/AcrR family transcriptional regulator [Phenylobacterium sp.]MBL8772998.1 TetR/AcrR family transcriptional regulator [Phenylobacterium sp.]
MARAKSAETPPTDDPAWALPAYQARSREQRDRLLKAGERAFAEHGFWQAHVADIARRAGCSVGSFYRRFQDKEALFFALQAHMAQRSAENITTFFADPACATDPLDKVFVRLVANSARSMGRIEGYFRALFELSLRGQDVWPSMRQLEIFEARKIQDMLEGRGLSVEAGFPERAQLAVRMIHGQIITQLLHGPGPFSIDDPRLADELGLLLIRYLGLEKTAA